MNKVQRRDFLKGLASIPFLGYFAFSYKHNIAKELSQKSDDYLGNLNIDKLEAPAQKLNPPAGNSSDKIRIGLVGNGWRGEELLMTLGFVHPDVIKKNTVNGQLNDYFRKTYAENENLNIEITAICDTFDVHAQRGIEISQSYIHEGNKPKAAKLYSSFRDMISSGEIDAIIIATADHMHAPIAIEAAKAGIHVYLEKPMSHSIEEAVFLRDTTKSKGVAFQLGHQNRQQMSYKIASELYRKGVLGDVSMVQTYTNRNDVFGAWIRDNAFDHKLGHRNNINWEEFLGNAPWQEFDLQKYFSWQRYSDFGTSITGNDFTHQFDAINQVLNLGIPQSVVASGGQYYFMHHGDMPDVFNAVFNYPERNLTLVYNGTLKNDMYQPTRILGSEATMDVDRAIVINKSNKSERYKNIKTEAGKPLYYYEPNISVDAISSATSRVYMKSGYGPTYIDGKLVNAAYLHLKEWVDAIRGHGQTSCNVDVGFEESVTFNLANLAYIHQKPVMWDKINEKAIIG